MSISAKSKPKWTDEQKRKFSENRKGNKNPMYGKTHTDEEKLRISQRTSGPNNPSYGKKNTDEYKKTMSERLSGPNNPRYGVVLSDEMKQRISASLLGKQKGKIIVNDGSKCKFINEFELANYLSSGYNLGRIKIDVNQSVKYESLQACLATQSISQREIPISRNS
jgi:hypothetical protein